MADELFSEFKEATNETPSFFESYELLEKSQQLKSRLEDVLGPLSEEEFLQLKPQALTDFQSAVASYLDQRNQVKYEEEEELFVNDTPSSSHSVANSVNNDNSNGSNDDSKSNVSNGNVGNVGNGVQPPQDDPNCRLLGSIQADAWCTRSGQKLATFGERITVHRSKPSKQSTNLIVRFCNSQGLDFARARENDAKYMAALLDSNVCKFEATVIYADPVLKLGSTVYLQVDVYLLNSAFFFDVYDSKLDLPNAPKSKKRILDESKETKEEKHIRERQIGLVQLFSKLNLIDDSTLKSLSKKSSDATNSASSTPSPKRNAFMMLGIKRKSPQPAATNTVNDAVNENNVDDNNVDEADEDQLNAFYKETVNSPMDTEESEPSTSFGLELHPYQKRGLHWMLQRERGSVQIGNDHELHPLWSELYWPNKEPFWANLHSGELSLSKPGFNIKTKGGILADEMGLGKTISALALIHSGEKESICHSTLIVAPMSLLSQWESEIAKSNKTPRNCGCFVYYGGNTSNQSLASSMNAFLESKSFDHKVVVTTYGMVISEYKQRLSGGTTNGNTKSLGSKGLLDINFDRVILDEAHMIKNRTTQTAKACFALKSARRWVLTGTPVVNRLEDLYSLIKFIGVEPWDNFTYWRSFITEQYENIETREQALKTVQAVVSPVCLRRTKDMRDLKTGEPLVKLPKKVVNIRHIDFSEEESVLYKHLFASVRGTVQSKVSEGLAGSNYTAILASLMRLRQVCCHPLLIRKPATATTTSTNVEESDGDDLSAKCGSNDEGSGVAELDLTAEVETLLEKFTNAPSLCYTAETLKSLLESSYETEECVICSEPPTIPVFTECLHSACRNCILAHIEFTKRKRSGSAICHICRSPIDSSRLFVLDRENKQLKPMNNVMQSAKIKALISCLQNRRDEKQGKAVVFSQFTSFMDLIEESLKDLSVPVYRFDGKMTQAQRSSAVEAFKCEPNNNAIFLLSLRAGGVGLNLIEANQAYLMDPWWSYSVESQAIDRIHRMGQTDQVTVTRFIIRGSIEEKILKIQDKKSVLSTVVADEERKSEQMENLKLLLDLDDENETGT